MFLFNDVIVWTSLTYQLKGHMDVDKAYVVDPDPELRRIRLRGLFSQ